MTYPRPSVIQSGSLRPITVIRIHTKLRTLRASAVNYLPSPHLNHNFRSNVRYCTASETCSGRMASLPAKSAMVRATLITRS